MPKEKNKIKKTKKKKLVDRPPTPFDFQVSTTHLEETKPIK